MTDNIKKRSLFNIGGKKHIEYPLPRPRPENPGRQPAMASYIGVIEAPRRKEE